MSSSAMRFVLVPAAKITGGIVAVVVSVIGILVLLFLLGIPVAMMILVAPTAHADSRGGIVVDVNIGPLISRLTGHAVNRVMYRDAYRCWPIVGYRFKSWPGREFVYARDTYDIEDDGATELIADRKRTHVRIDGKEIELGGEPDQFGFVDVELPDAPLPKVRARR